MENLNLRLHLFQQRKRMELVAEYNYTNCSNYNNLVIRLFILVIQFILGWSKCARVF